MYAYQGVRNVRFLENFLCCFLKTLVLRFAFLAYYRQIDNCNQYHNVLIFPQATRLFLVTVGYNLASNTNYLRHKIIVSILQKPMRNPEKRPTLKKQESNHMEIDIIVT